MKKLIILSLFLIGCDQQTMLEELDLIETKPLEWDRFRGQQKTKDKSSKEIKKEPMIINKALPKPELKTKAKTYEELHIEKNRKIVAINSKLFKLERKRQEIIKALNRGYWWEFTLIETGKVNEQGQELFIVKELLEIAQEKTKVLGGKNETK